jgi:pimeloyl-ACP methyl ester carboxylesterase
MLEVIDKGTAGQTNPVPLLFVHGAWHGAWCWDEHFLDYFAQRGYRAVALSLRGHAGSPSPKPLSRCSIADYVDDVASIADTLPTPPVVIGHSMGGMVVQKYLETHDAPAAVLLASLPSRGLRGFLLRYARQHPLRLASTLVTGRAAPLFCDADAVREKFFSPWTPEDTVTHCRDRLQNESRRVVLDALFLNLPRPQRVSTPLLALGAAVDDCFTVDEVLETARAYGTAAEIFPNMGHDMMLEPQWAAVAGRIDTWLAHRELATPA